MIVNTAPEETKMVFTKIVHSQMNVFSAVGKMLYFSVLFLTNFFIQTHGMKKDSNCCSLSGGISLLHHICVEA